MKYEIIPTFEMPKQKCHTCMLNKITRTPFRTVERNTQLFELIHNNLCDFHSSRPLGNKKYMIIFIDDHSIFCYVYLLHA